MTICHRRIMGPAPCVTFSGCVGDLQVHVVWNGKCVDHGVDNVGTVPASLASYLAILALNPDLVISAGTAGGFQAQVRMHAWSAHEEPRGSSHPNPHVYQGAAIGDIYLSNEIINHDRRIPIPGFDKYGIGLVKSPSCPALQVRCFY